MGAARLLRHDLLHDVRAARVPERRHGAGVADRDRRHRRAAHARWPGLAATRRAARACVGELRLRGGAHLRRPRGAHVPVSMAGRRRGPLRRRADPPRRQPPPSARRRPHPARGHGRPQPHARRGRSGAWCTGAAACSPRAGDRSRLGRSRSATALPGRRLRALRREALGRGRRAGDRDARQRTGARVRAACRWVAPSWWPRGTVRAVRFSVPRAVLVHAWGRRQLRLRLMVASPDEPFALRARWRADAWRPPTRLSPRRRAR